VFWLLTLAPARALGWGEEGHQLIMRLAVDALPAELRQRLARHRHRLAMAAIDADLQPHGKERHYLHLDDEPSPAPATATGEPGTLPATVVREYRRLVAAFAGAPTGAGTDADDLVRALGDLAHFVGDTHQPVHTTRDDDGRLAGNCVRGTLGLHWRFEKRFVQANLATLEAAVRARLRSARVTEVDDLAAETRRRAAGAHRWLPALQASDRLLFPCDGRWSGWAAALPHWTAPAVEQLELASQWLADLILTAALESGYTR
jgi:hypothetical protein